MPTFKGNLLSWLAENIKYPVEAASNGEQGTVIVKYIITANGEVKDPVIVRSISPSLDKEALRVVSVMPRWNPGKNKERLFRCTILYLFALNCNKIYNLVSMRLGCKADRLMEILS